MEIRDLKAISDKITEVIKIATAMQEAYNSSSLIYALDSLDDAQTIIDAMIEGSKNGGN